MAIARYLAMTAGEFRENRNISASIGWMACHFSPYGPGISNLPRELPPESLLILDDVTPIHGHDPQVICQQLTGCVQDLSCAAVLLDFQREGYPEARELARALTQALPCPVVVTPEYAAGLSCPVLLPPVPPSTPLPDALAPWQGRECWLELALNGEVISVTERGAAVSPLSAGQLPQNSFREESLHCHYALRVSDACAVCTLWRTREDLAGLLEEAESLGVTQAVGLNQELGTMP